MASEQLEPVDIESYVILGELSLSGEIKPINGISYYGPGRQGSWL